MFWIVVGCCPVRCRMLNGISSPHPLDAACTHHQKCLMCCAMLCLVSQSCLTLCNPTGCSPPGSSVHVDSPGKNTGVGCHASSRGPSQHRDQTRSPALQADSLLSELPGLWPLPSNFWVGGAKGPQLRTIALRSITVPTF